MQAWNWELAFRIFKAHACFPALLSTSLCSCEQRHEQCAAFKTFGAHSQITVKCRQKQNLLIQIPCLVCRPAWPKTI